jgi:hypothetical protein
LVPRNASRIGLPQFPFGQPVYRSPTPNPAALVMRRAQCVVAVQLVHGGIGGREPERSAEALHGLLVNPSDSQSERITRGLSGSYVRVQLPTLVP